MFVPKSIVCLKDYSWSKFGKDLTAGVVVGVVALPLAMAFAIGSGVSPQRGLFTAVVAGFIISVLGGSRVQIGGPTGAFVVIVAGIVLNPKFGYDGLVLATVMAGVFLVLMGLTRLGAAVKFIPYPVVTGFTSGIALYIFTSQINDLLGLHLDKPPSDFLGKWSAYFNSLGSLNWDAAWPTILLSSACLAILLFWPKISRRVPAPIIALAAAALLVVVLEKCGVKAKEHLGIDTIGSRFNGIPSAVADPQWGVLWSQLSLTRIQELFGPAMVIALLAAIESLLSAVVADGMIGGRHKPNMELIAQGVANIASPLLGGIPATGAIARTATNVKCGGRTPVAGIVHSFTLLVILLVCAPMASYVPLCCLAAVLVVVAYSMAEVHRFAGLVAPIVRYVALAPVALARGQLRALRRPLMSDALVLVVTFLLTVVFDLSVAVEVGLVLAFFLFIRHMSQVTNLQVVTREFVDNGDKKDPNAIAARQVPSGVEVYEVNGPFFFGVVDKVKDLLQMVAGKPKVFILRMRNVPMMDATGIEALLDLRRKCAQEGGTLVLAEIHTQPYIALDRSGRREEFGVDDVTAHIDDALNRARKLLGLPEVEAQAPRVPEVARDSGTFKR
jgi:SulP family sulfate permease